MYQYTIRLNISLYSSMFL